MRGDRLILKEHHRRAAIDLADRIERTVPHESPRPTIIAIGGESGSGKSEMARALADELTARGHRVIVLQQDDYFAYPPRTNDRRRREEIARVGPHEVRLDLLEHHLGEIAGGASKIITPLVYYAEDRIGEQRLDLRGVDTVIVEGTYTLLLENVHLRVFLDRTIDDTLASRIERGREPQDEFLERVLRLEHDIIRPHRETADILITRDFRVVDARRPARNTAETINEGSNA